jgi:hypothetical protein
VRIQPLGSDLSSSRRNNPEGARFVGLHVRQF